MSISDLKIGARLFILSSLLLLAVSDVGFLGWHALIDNNQRAAKAMEHAVLMRRAVDTERYAQVLFKSQVQEWKNTLLRGHDQANFDKSWATASRQIAQLIPAQPLSVLLA